MIVGVVKEIKEDENRVALIPVGAELLKEHGHRVLVEKEAGKSSGFSDCRYESAGAEIFGTAEEVYSRADMIVKVKEPLPREYPLLRSRKIVVAFFHFAASEELTRAVVNSNCVAIAYETIETDGGLLPLLSPMSEVAGRMAVHQAAAFLERKHGGRGILLGGVPGLEPATVVIIGGGVAGANAAKTAAGMGARVYILDINLERLRYLSDVMPPNVVTMMSNVHNIRHLVTVADVIISSVLVHGGKAPRLLTKAMLKGMKEGAVVIDLAVDQGGSLETSRPTTHKEPVYDVNGIIHYCVGNMPGAVPMTSTPALTNATLPYILEIADKGFKRAMFENREIRRGSNIMLGCVTYKKVAEAFGMPYVPTEEVLAGAAR